MKAEVFEDEAKERQICETRPSLRSFRVVVDYVAFVANSQPVSILHDRSSSVGTVVGDLIDSVQTSFNPKARPQNQYTARELTVKTGGLLRGHRTRRLSSFRVGPSLREPRRA